MKMRTNEWISGLVLAGMLMCGVANADVVYSSYPNTKDPVLGLNETNLRGVLFSLGNDSYQLTGITAPLTYLSGYNLPGATSQIPTVPSMGVNFQIWSSQPTSLYGDNRQRPDQLLGSWASPLIPGNNYSPQQTFTFTDISVLTPNGPILQQNQSYWFVIDTGWQNVNVNSHVQWAGSSSVTGYGHGLEIISNNNMMWMSQDLYMNMDPGGFAAFKIDGNLVAASPVPAPPAFILMLSGLGVLGLSKRFRNADKQA